MKRVVSFSGGRTSAYLCKIMIDTYGRDNVDFIYMDTGAEHQKTYEFIRRVNNEFGLNLICLRGDFSRPLGAGVGYSVVDINSLKSDLKPFKEMMNKYGVPYIGGMFCTDRMKLKPFQKYCNDAYGKNNYETWLGIRIDEPSRYLSSDVVKLMSDEDSDNEMFADLFKTMRLNDGDPKGEYDIFDGMWPEPSSYDKANFDNSWDRAVSAIDSAFKNKTKNNLFYMMEISDYQKEDILNWWGKKTRRVYKALKRKNKRFGKSSFQKVFNTAPFDLNLDEWSGNCEFCPKKSNLKLAASQRDSSKSYIKYIDALYSDTVRVDDNTGHYSKMYRGKQSLESLIASFDGVTGKEIKARIRGSKMIDTNSCSESCEVFNQ